MPPGNKSRVSASTPISRTDMLTFLHCNESNQTQIEMKLRRFDVESGERLKQRSITIYGIIEHRLLVASKLYSMVEKVAFHASVMPTVLHMPPMTNTHFKNVPLESM